ncbi:MAG: helix-turn-helix domain-containing protein [bacterium]|nr:helix-turn-helix domain-containing protein [bacterium]
MANNNEKKRLNFDDLADVVTVAEMAAFMGVSTRMVSDMIYKGKLKSFKFGSCRLILKQDIAEMIGYSAEKEQMLKLEKEKQEEQKRLEEEAKAALKENGLPSKKYGESIRIVSIPKGNRRASYGQLEM